MIARIAYAILAGIIALIVCVVVADVFNVAELHRFASLIGLLVAIVVFFGGSRWSNRSL